MNRLANAAVIAACALGAVCLSLPALWLSLRPLAWALICAIALMLLTLQLHLPPVSFGLPTAVVVVLAIIWLIAASVATVAVLARMSVQRLVDDVVHGAFAVLTGTTLVVQLWLHWHWRAHGTVAAAAAAGTRPMTRPLRRYCIMGATRISVIVALLLAVGVVYGDVGEIQFVVSQPPPLIVWTSRGAVGYWCAGDVRNGSLAVLLAGFFAPEEQLAYIGNALAGYTRTCLFYRSGTGWSETQRTVGFEVGNPRSQRCTPGCTCSHAAALSCEHAPAAMRSLALLPLCQPQADADDMHAILTAEMDAAAVPTAARVAIVGGHSRGHISALTLKLRHAAAYARVLVLSLDGSYCGYALH